MIIKEFNENQAFSYQLPNEAFIDLDGDVLTYSATLSDGSALPSWLSFDANTQTFSGTPSFDDAGVLAIKVTANDGQATASQTFTLDVLDVNRAPVVIEPVINQSTNENQVFTYQLPADAFIDLDNDTLSYSATLSDGSALPSWLSFDANTQTFSGTPSFDDADVLAIKVTANDGQATASQTFTITIQDVPNNTPPVLISTPAMLTNGTEDTTYAIKASDLLQGYSDIDGDTLNVINLQTDNGSLIDNQDGTFTLTPNANFNGTVNLSYQVSDGNGGIVDASNSVFIQAVNDAPSTLVPVDSQEINENQAFSYQLPNEAFIDLDGDVLTYSATLSDGSALPSWLSFDANTQTFSGTPSFEDAGVLSLKVMATDPAGLFAEQVFSLDVIDVPQNHAPSLA